MEHELSDENKATGAHEPPTNVALSNKRRSFRSLLVKSSWAQTVGFKVFGNKGKRDDNTIGKRNDNNQTDVIRTTNNARPEFFSRKPKRSTHTALAEPLAELGRLDKKTTNSEWKTVTLDESEKDSLKLLRRRSLGDLFKSIRLSKVNRTKFQDMLQDNQDTEFESRAEDQVDGRHPKMSECPALGELEFDMKFYAPPNGSLTRSVSTVEKKTIDTASSHQEQDQALVMPEDTVAHDSGSDNAVNQLVVTEENVNSSGKAVERVAVIFPATMECEEHVEYFTGAHGALMAIYNQRKLFADRVLFNSWTDTFYALPPAFNAVQTQPTKDYVKLTDPRLSIQSSSKVDSSITLPGPWKLSACSQQLNVNGSKDIRTAIALEMKTGKDVDTLVHNEDTLQGPQTDPENSLNNGPTPLIVSASDDTDLAQKFIEVPLITLISSLTGEPTSSANDPWIWYQIHKKTRDTAGLVVVPFMRSTESSTPLDVLEYENTPTCSTRNRSLENAAAGHTSSRSTKASTSINFDEMKTEGGLNNNPLF